MGKRIPSVKDLRQRGFKVYIKHDLEECRYSQHDYSLLTEGMTSVNVVVPNSGMVASDCAYCSIKDQYDKKMGVRIALGRALKHLERAGYEV